MVPLSVASAVAILLTFDQSVVASSHLNHLRHASSANIDVADSSSSADVVQYLSASRSLRADVDLTQCYKDMVTAAGELNILTKDAYHLFADIMSNQWFSDNGITTYTELPFDMKFAFVTLACECRNLGGGENCCENERASLNVEGADGQEVSQAQTDYLNDICSLTYSTIGSDRINPHPGEMPTTAQPTTAPPTPPTQPPAPTSSPTKKVDPIITPPTPAPAPEFPSGGLSPGAVAGVSLAAAAVLTLIVFLIGGRKEEEENEEENLEDIEADDMMKVNVNAAVGDDAPNDGGSPDETKSMTTAFSNQSTIATGVNVMEDSENETGDGEKANQPHEIPGDLSSLSSCSHHDAANTSYSALPPAKDDEDMMDDALDYAIENGNWEQVAASAAALVEREN